MAGKFRLCLIIPFYFRKRELRFNPLDELAPTIRPCVLLVPRAACLTTHRTTPFSAYEHTRDTNNARAPPQARSRCCRTKRTKLELRARVFVVYIRDPTFPLLCAALALLIWSFVPLIGFNPFASQSGLLLSLSLSLVKSFFCPSCPSSSGCI